MTTEQDLIDRIDQSEAKVEAALTTMAKTLNQVEPMARTIKDSKEEQEVIRRIESKGKVVKTAKPKEQSRSFQGAVTTMIPLVFAVYQAWQTKDMELLMASISGIATNIFTIHGILRRKELT